MLKSDEIKEELRKIVEGVRNPPAILNFVPSPKVSRERFDNLISRCVELHKKVSALQEQDDTWECTIEFYDIESNYKRLRAKLMLFPAIMLVYIFFSVSILVLDKVDVVGFIKNVFGVEAPERLITFGLSGAFLYLATSVLSSITKPTDKKDPTGKVVEFSIRVLMAVIVPIILVSLFFNAEGQFSETTITPELLAFGCGYSAKLVMDIFNKIVEKCANMIQAI